MKKKMHPYLFILLSFLSVILIGSLLLCLPISSKSGSSIEYINALFMSTSAVCVTGLSVLPNSLLNDFSIFGNIVMVILMEIGGLSIITIAVFFFTKLGGKIGISSNFLLKESLNQDSLQDLIKLVSRIIRVSLFVQIVCATVNFFPLYEYTTIIYGESWINIFRSIGMSLFHSAASFNNAGFDIFGTSSMEMFSSTSNIVSDISVLTINFTTILMIVLGGLGFTVIVDLVKIRKFKKFKLHSKITIITTLILIVAGTIFVKITSDMPWLESLFTAVTTRTAGFATYNMGKLSSNPGAYGVVILLMMIGASPCSTGGGIKTTTFAIIMIAIINFAKGKKAAIFNRRISESQIFKAFALMGVGVSLVFVATIITVTIQPELTFEKMFFEVVSAFSTTGLSMGITTKLNGINKIILCFLMFFGRIGPLTIIGILNKNWMIESTEKIKFVEESVIIG